jgi:hypothetical protein
MELRLLCSGQENRDMYKTKRWLRSLFLIAAITVPAATIGCAAHVRYYDVEHRDYHHWDDHEDHAYRAYLSERHEPYRDFKKRSPDEQKDYWNWRHSHPS